MNGRVSREIRSLMQVTQEDGSVKKVTEAPKYFIASKKKVMAYVQDDKGVVSAKPVDRIVIVNETKNKYRKVKKALKAERRNGGLKKKAA